MPETATDTMPGFDRLALIASGPAFFSAVVAGLELDIFRLLSQRPGATCDELAQAVAAPRHQLRVLMLTLCATGLVRRSDGRYWNAEVAEAYLAPDGPDSWRHVFLSRQVTDYPGFPRTTEAIRTGTNAGLDAHDGDGATLYERLAADAGMQSTLHASVRAFTLRTLPALLGRPELGAVRSLLDVGGGTGTVAEAIATRFPGTAVTVFDLPSMAGEIAARADRAQAGGRLRLHPGDLFADPFPAGIDGVLFCHVLEICSPAQVRALLAKAYDAVPAGGTALIYSFTAPDDENDGVLAAQLSLYLNVLATGTGMAYPAREYAGWLSEAGWQQVQVHAGLPYEHSLIVATKPAAQQE
ncbi:MAG TPA: methyltransferase [Trebonia sp.]|nr:methyltransferase [Trebonia sp.]